MYRGNILLMERYVLNIVPVAASRPRVSRFATYYPKRYTAFRKAMKEIAPALVYKEGVALDVDIVFEMKIPKCSKKKALAMDGTLHTKKPDIDNLIKGVLDSILADDSIVARVKAVKIWSSQPRIIVTIKER